MTPLSLAEELIDKAIERKIDDACQAVTDTTKRFLSPSAATIKRWRRQEARRLDRKNQLPLPLIFSDEPDEETT